MLKGYKYNQSYRKIGHKSMYEQEHDLLHGLLASPNTNIAFEYEDTREAKNAAVQLKRYIEMQKMPITIMQRVNRVVAVRTDNRDDV